MVAESEPVTDAEGDVDRPRSEPPYVRPGPRFTGRTAGLLVIALACLIAALVWWGGRDQQVAITPTPQPTATTGTASERDVLAMAALEAQRDAVMRGEKASFLVAADPQSQTAQAEASVTFDNLASLRLAAFETRYVAANVGGLTPEQEATLGDSGWTADVEV